LVLDLFAHPQEPVLRASCTIAIVANLCLKLPDAFLSDPQLARKFLCDVTRLIGPAFCDLGSLPNQEDNCLSRPI